MIFRLLGENLKIAVYGFVTRFRIKLFGKKAIKEFHRITAEHNKTYWLAFGTLLGAYREGGFIKNDDDIDVSMFCSDITSDFIDSLRFNGFLLDHCILTGDKRFCQLSFSYHGIPFDIYGFRNCSSDDFITGFIPRAIHGKDWNESFRLNKFKILHVKMPFGGTKLVDFAGIHSYIPIQTKEFLRMHYGEDFMTPIKGKKGSSRETIVEIPIDEQTASIVPLQNIYKTFS